MRTLFVLFLSSIMHFAFSQFKEDFKYLNSNGKEYYSVERTLISKSEFIDTKRIPYDNGLIAGISVSTDTFYVKRGNWYIKEYGKYHLFLGSKSFKKDSLILNLDLSTKRSDLGFWNDTQTVYPYSYIYKPERKIRLGNGKVVYVYTAVYYIFNQEADFSSPEKVYFDPTVGIVQIYSLTTGTTILKGYKHLDKLRLE